MSIPFLTTAFLAALTVGQIPDLNALQWNHRVLLLFAPNAADAQLTKQKQWLDGDQRGLTERDVAVFQVTGDSVEAVRLRSRFGVRPERFAVVLVGKDGGRKLKKEEPVELSALFGKIDSMPMRRDEMHRENAK